MLLKGSIFTSLILWKCFRWTSSSSALSLGTHLQMQSRHTHVARNWGTYINFWSVFLDLVTPLPYRQSTVFVFISLGRLFSVKGPPRGRLAVPQHSSSLHQRPPRSAISGLSTLHKRTAAQRVRGEGRDGRWRRLREIVSKKWDKRGRKWMEKGWSMRMCVCVCVRFTVPLHACTCFPCVCNVCFAHFAAMPTT